MIYYGITLKLTIIYYLYNIKNIFVHLSLFTQKFLVIKDLWFLLFKNNYHLKTMQVIVSENIITNTAI